MVVCTDVCIIGAGIAGIVTAKTVAESSRSGIVVVESGGDVANATNSASLNEVEHERRIHLGATLGRERCLGGTSRTWGGQLLSLMPCDFIGNSDDEHTHWPMAEAELRSYYARVLQLFHVRDFTFESNSLPPELRRSEAETLPGFHVRYSVWPPFARRNVWSFVGSQLKRVGRVRFLDETHFLNWAFDPDNGRIRAVICRDKKGDVVRVEAKTFVVASGCIESTRQLLLLNRQSNDRIFPLDSGLGRFFEDHFSAEAFSVKPYDLFAFNRVFGYSFHDGVMRTLRFERVRSKENLRASSYAHVTFSFPADSGFENAKHLLRQWQESGHLLPSMAQVKGVLGQARELSMLAWWRYVRSQLWLSPRAEFRIAVDIEQEHLASNRIYLGNSVDRYGVPRACIDWDVSERDVDNFDSCCREFLSSWPNSELAKLGKLEWRMPGLESKPNLRAHFLNTARDVYHPSGSTRMGSDQRHSVVDGEMKVHGIQNLYVASTSVFPSSGSANPTFTLIALSIRLGDMLAGHGNI